MADDPKRTPKGTFKPGVSGNPSGVRKDAAAPPAGKPKYRTDGWVNFFTGHGVYGQDKRQGSSFQSLTLSFDQLYELWRGDDLAARAVETLPKEALREGFDVVIPENEDGSDESDLIAQIMEKLEDLQAVHAIHKGLNWERGYGGAAVMIGANDGQSDLTKPLNIDRVRSIDWLTALEPREVIPVFGYADPSAPKYGEPEIYRISSRTILPPKNGVYGAQTMDIHESRLLLFPGQRVSRYQSFLQNGWGDSVLLRMYRVLRDFNLAWGSAGTLVADFASAVYKMKDLWETLGSTDGAAAFADRLQSMNLAKSTINATVIDAEDEFKREQTPISGLPDLMDRFATRLAAAADMPLTLLFGTSPGGLNATGESDIRFFYDRVSSFQRDRVAPHLKKLIKIIIRSLGKKEPDKWSVQFRPLWQESAQDRAQAMLTQAQADHIWITDSVLAAEEVADSHWGSGEWNPEIKIDFDARDKQEQTVSAPIKQADLDVLNPDSPKYAPSKLDPAHPDYIAPPPDPNAKPPFGGKPGGGSPGGGKPGGGSPGGSPGGGKPVAAAAKKPVPRKDAERLDYVVKVHGQFFVYSEGTDGSERERLGGPYSTKTQALTRLRQIEYFKTHKTDDFNPEQPRGPDGKWTGGSSGEGAFHPPTAHALLTASAESEAAGRGAGFTYSPAVGKFKTSGYSVSIHPEFETKLSGKSIAESTVDSYIAPKEAFFRSHPDAHIGGWYNPDDDHWYLDVSHVTDSKLDAVGLAARYNQKGIYDLKEGRTIYSNEYGEIAAGDRGDSASRGHQGALRSSYDDVRGDRGGDEPHPHGGTSQARPAGRLDFSPDEARASDGKWTGGSANLPLEDNARWYGAKTEGERQRLLLEGNIGIPRAKMPQIDDKDAGAFLNSLKEKGVHVHPHEMVLAASLKPTQNEMNMAKVESMAKSWNPALAKPILISNDGHILDGHHRWAAQVGANPFATIPVRRIDMPIRQLVAAANAFPATHHEGVQEVKDHLDYSDDQPRGADGKWTGGAAPYDHKAEAAKALAARESAELAHRNQQGDLSHERWLAQRQGKPVDMNLNEAAQRKQMMQRNNAEANRQSALAKNPDTAAREGLEKPNTLQGQARLPGDEFKTPEELARAQRDRAEVDRILANDNVDWREGDLKFAVLNGNQFAQEALEKSQAATLAEANAWAAGRPEFNAEAEKKYVDDYVKNYIGMSNANLPAEAKAAFDRNKVSQFKVVKKNELRMQRALDARAAQAAKGKEIPMSMLPGEETRIQKAQAAAEQSQEDKFAGLPRAERQAQMAMLQQEREVARRQDPDYQLPKPRDYVQEQLAGVAGYPSGTNGEVSLEDRKNALAGEVMAHERTSMAGRMVGEDRVERVKQAAAEEADRKAKDIAMKIPMRTADPDGVADMEKRGIVSMKSFKNDNTSDSYRAVLDDGSFAMWKPADGEDSHLRRNIEGGTYYLREAAAAKVAPLFGVSDILPATVAGHDKDGNVGTLQSWATGSKSVESYEDRGDDFVFDREKAEKMRVFDYVAGNSDRHERNVMVKEEGGKYIPIMIDNGLTFPNGKPERLLQPYEHIDHSDEGLLAETHNAIRNLDLDKMASTLRSSGIEEPAIKAAVSRGRYLKANPEILAVDNAQSSGSYAWNHLKNVGSEPGSSDSSGSGGSGSGTSNPYRQGGRSGL